MKRCFCSRCVSEMVFLETGHDEQGKIFDLYQCPVCKSHVRNFNTPEKLALSDTDSSVIQIPMWSDKPSVHY